MTKTGLVKRFLSLLYPVKIWSGSSIENPVLELFLFRGQLQLATDNAIYSDGDRYRPLASAIRKLRNKLPEVKNVLVLGAGLGSIVLILRKYGCFPAVTLVDIDETVLALNKKLLAGDPAWQPEMICSDAGDYIKNNGRLFDMIVVDVFKGRTVPGFVSDPIFLQLCQERLTSRGILVINFIINDKEDEKALSRIKNAIYGNVRVLDLGLNKVIISTT